MAIQVSPVLSEGEMKSFQDMFARIANTITQASELTAKFTDLSHKVDDLSHSLEVAQARNSNLDEALLRVRTERDELSVKLQDMLLECVDLRSALASVERANAANVDTAQALSTQAAEARKDRDDAQFQVLTLTEELDKAKAALASIHAALGFTPSTPTPAALIEPQPTPEPTLRSEPVFVGEGEGFKAEPDKPAEYRKVYRGDSDFDQDRWMNERDHTCYGFANDSEDSKADWYKVPV